MKQPDEIQREFLNLINFLVLNWSFPRPEAKRRVWTDKVFTWIKTKLNADKYEELEVELEILGFRKTGTQKPFFNLTTETGEYNFDPEHIPLFYERLFAKKTKWWKQKHQSER